MVCWLDGLDDVLMDLRLGSLEAWKVGWFDGLGSL
jgi:hypothetical protein